MMMMMIKNHGLWNSICSVHTQAHQNIQNNYYFYFWCERIFYIHTHIPDSGRITKLTERVIWKEWWWRRRKKFPRNFHSFIHLFICLFPVRIIIHPSRINYQKKNKIFFSFNDSCIKKINKVKKISSLFHRHHHLHQHVFHSNIFVVYVCVFNDFEILECQNRFVITEKF